MTNEPAYDQQLALASYWKDVGGTTFLHGTNRSSDRFARASFYIHAIPETANAADGVAEVMSVMRNAVATPNTFWIDLKKANFEAGATVFRFEFMSIHPKE